MSRNSRWYQDGDIQEIGFLVTVGAVVVLLVSSVLYGAEQQQRQQNFQTVKQTCQDHGGVQSFDLEQGFVCQDGSAYLFDHLDDSFN